MGFLENIEGWAIYKSTHGLLARHLDRPGNFCHVDIDGQFILRGTHTVPARVVYRIIDHYEASLHRSR